MRRIYFRMMLSLGIDADLARNLLAERRRSGSAASSALTLRSSSSEVIGMSLSSVEQPVVKTTASFVPLAPEAAVLRFGPGARRHRRRRWRNWLGRHVDHGRRLRLP
jgi:hypothetical protein